MKTIQCSEDIKTCMEEIKSHIAANPETVSGNVRSEMIMNISVDTYNMRSTNLSYNNKIEFMMQCDPHSVTQLFQVQ